MQTVETSFLNGQLEERKQRLEAALSLTPENRDLAGLLHAVDSALARMDRGTYGICEECHDTIEQDRLLADPLVRFCLSHLTPEERNALQRDLDLASAVQRKLLPEHGLKIGSWQTCYHYAPVGPVSGDYCDLIPFGSQLFFALGDVAGKGVAASMLMAQLHALFRTLIAMSLPLSEIVSQVNRVVSDTALAGQYATLVCGLAHENGDVEIHNAGHCPALLVQRGHVLQLDATGVPLGMFSELEFSSTRLRLHPGDTLFLYTDGLSEARCADEEYGIARLTDFLRERATNGPSDLLTACIEDLRHFAKGTPQGDDLSALVLQHQVMN